MHAGEDNRPFTVSDERRIMTVGNSLGVTLPPPILDALDLEKGDRVEVKREDGCAILEIRPAEDASPETAEAD